MTLIPTPELTRRLGIGRSTVYRRIADGTFRSGEHYVRTGDRGQLRWRYDKVAQALGQRAPRREVKRGGEGWRG